MNAHPLPAPVAGAFADQAVSCLDLGSPLLATICTLVAERGLPDSQTRRRIATWPGLADWRGSAVPLRLAGALHWLVLDGADARLAAAFPPNPLDRDVLWQAIVGAVADHDRFIVAFLESAPQTNEVARAGLLLPTLLALYAEGGLPLHLLEPGASAGLNQNLDRFHYDYGGWQWGDRAARVAIACDWRGAAPPPAERDLVIAERAGCDIAPVPVATDDDRRRLLSYAWADQPQRLARLVAAMDLARDHPPTVDEAGAADWLEDRLGPLPDGRHTVVLHTVMWQYLPDAERARAEAALRRAGAAATPDRPLSWLRFEADAGEPGGAIMLTRWTGAPTDGITAHRGRGDFHGRWLRMDA